MSEIIHLNTPLTDVDVERLHAGDQVALSGVIYGARDAAHKRFVEALDRGEPLPIDVKGQVLYFVGPSPARPGRPIGSAGPTTSGRMDAYSPRLMEHGLKGMIGKGYRSAKVKEAMQAHRCVYFGAIGGAAAVIARCIKESKVIAYAELGPEAVHRLLVEDFPVIVLNDVFGNDLYAEGVRQYQLA